MVKAGGGARLLQGPGITREVVVGVYQPALMVEPIDHRGGLRRVFYEGESSRCYRQKLTWSISG
jgi:hypothetical protein